MTCEIVVILCDSWQDAEDSFDVFTYYLSVYEPESVRSINEACLCVETDSDLRYIFTDARMQGVFEDITVDFIDSGSFFDTLNEDDMLLTF